jgi:hypothetical protein
VPDGFCCIKQDFRNVYLRFSVKILPLRCMDALTSAAEIWQARAKQIRQARDGRSSQVATFLDPQPSQC